jgi:hypothetical protein
MVEIWSLIFLFLKSGHVRMLPVLVRDKGKGSLLVQSRGPHPLAK